MRNWWIESKQSYGIPTWTGVIKTFKKMFICKHAWEQQLLRAIEKGRFVCQVDNTTSTVPITQGKYINCQTILSIRARVHLAKTFL